MNYNVNSETMRVKWMESIFTVFEGHRESLLCQSLRQRERGENIPPKTKSQQLSPRGLEAVNPNGLLQEELYLCDYLQDSALELNSSTLQDAEQGQRGACCDSEPCHLATHKGGMSLTLQSILP